MSYKNTKNIKLKKNSGQAVVEYILVLAIFVSISVYGFNILKCNLHKLWVTTACNILYPYPATDATDLNEYCAPIDNCF